MSARALPPTQINIDPDIQKALTLPSAVYTDRTWYARIVEDVLARSWHVVDAATVPGEPGEVAPYELLPGSLDEPLILSRDDGGTLRALSNVCTHRGNLILERPCKQRGLRCGYHGRRFGLDGTLQHMPEFASAENFPGPADHLPRVPLETWGPLLFASLDPVKSLDALVSPVNERLAWLDFAALSFDPTTSRDYTFDGNWALYCDNYLEGLHVPYVHPGLATALSYSDYSTELLPEGVLQVGVAAEGKACFTLPSGHVDAQRRVAGYYYFLFPCTMLNFYPFGLSLNIVQPLGPRRTRVRFLSYVTDPAEKRRGAAADLHTVELEDEAVVTRVDQGVRSRLYDRGRYSPSHETGVHHFHRLLADALNRSTG